MIDTSQLWLEKTPTDKDSHFNWTIRRASHEKPTNLIVLSRELFGIRTHFWSGRTVPCLRTGCDACKAGRLSRWTGYLACIEPSTWSQVLFEYTPPAAEQLLKMIQEQGYLRGSKITAGRCKKTANGRVTVAPRGLYEDRDKLPEAPELLPILFHIWGMKTLLLSEESDYSRDDLPTSEQPRKSKPRGKRVQEDPAAAHAAVKVASETRLPEGF